MSTQQQIDKQRKIFDENIKLSKVKKVKMIVLSNARLGQKILFCPYYMQLTNFKNQAPTPDDAVAALRRAHELSGDIPFTLGFLAYGCGRAGRRDEAKRLLGRAEEIAAAGYVPPTTFAMGHIGLGDWDSALMWMDRAIDARDPIIMPIKTFPFLDPVRGDAKFRALLRKMHLQ